jgi:choline dehydrogenase-like flavoprotein
VVLMHPSSRGSVHIQSNDHRIQPRIDPAYLGSPSDLEIAKLGVKHVLKFAETAPWKKLVTKCLLPADLEKEHDDPLGAYCREWVDTTFHWVGTVAMLPREKGGVVDSRLKVYGLANLRVVSVFSEEDPILLAAYWPKRSMRQ